MSELLVHLDTSTIDEQIEQSLRVAPTQQVDTDSRYLQDLQYLYRKEQILAHAQQRLMLTNQLTANDNRELLTDISRQERNTVSSQPYRSPQRKTFSWPGIAAILAAAVLLLGVLFGTTQFLNAHSQPQAATLGQKGTSTANPAANIVFSDPLSQNIHGFPVSDNGVARYFFKGGTYHILNQGYNGAAVLLHEEFKQTTLSYQLTMQEITGDDTSSTNTFGMILRYNEQASNGRTLVSFYIFEILNKHGSSSYSFYKYENSKSSPWTQLITPIKTGREFHAGHGPQASNTVKISTAGSLFTFYVNDQQVGTARDSSIASGRVGMLVNLKGTEVAFSNMLITRP